MMANLPESQGKGVSGARCAGEGMMLQDRLLAWLTRPSRSRAVVHLDDLPVSLGTDVGLVREQNQDVVVAARLTLSRAPNASAIVAVVADGMGGMRDGKACACLATASFLSSFFRHARLPLEDRMQAALREANKAVFGLAGGQGGSTIAAIAVDASSALVTGHVGDSRIYGLRRSESPELVRLSVDDSLEEAVGGSGRQLLQFIGMGEGIMPHTSILPLDYSAIFLTTDGVHFVHTEVFGRVLELAPSTRNAVERALALSRWCGGPDNASTIWVDVKAIAAPKDGTDASLFEIWDPFSKLEILFVEGEGLARGPDQPFGVSPPNDRQKLSEEGTGDPSAEVRKAATARQARPSQRKKRGKGSVSGHGSPEPQLKIEIDEGTDS